MAISPIYAEQLRRWVKRLREDRFPLSEREWALLDEMLSMDEQIEAHRRANDERAVRQLLVLPSDHPIWTLPDIRLVQNNDLDEALTFLRRYRPSFERLVAERQVSGPSDDLENARGMLQGLLDKVFTQFDRLNELEQRVWKHRGARTWGNLPRLGESNEDYYFPDQPNSKRIGYIEIIEAKIAFSTL